MCFLRVLATVCTQVATAEEPPAFSVYNSSQIPEAALFLKQLTRHVRPGCLIELGVGPIHQLSWFSWEVMGYSLQV